MPNEVIFEKKHLTGQVTCKNKRQKNKNQGPFHDDLHKLMIGFGDDHKPLDSSVELLEIYVEEFITNLVLRASRRSQRLGNNTVTVADILKVLQPDQKKYLRMPYVLTMTQ
jgi:histone H3/H4